jgi:hypothetical protein
MQCGIHPALLSDSKRRARRESCAPQHRYTTRMKTTDTPPPLPGADDALFDDIERRLRALTTAPLHPPSAVPSRCVDEFADGFLGYTGGPALPARQLARQLAAYRPSGYL